MIFQNKKNLILQFGFQSYPTLKENLNLEKLFKIKNIFPQLNFSFADHLSFSDSFAKSLPIYLQMRNIFCLEKHICIDRKKAQYDYHSALEFSEFSELVNNISSVYKLKKLSHLHNEEKKYLDSTIQSMVFNKNLNLGSRISINDVIFKRTSQKKANFSKKILIMTI